MADDNERIQVKQPRLRHSVMAAFALAGALALSPDHGLAGEASVTPGNGDTAAVQVCGTKVETDASGNVKVHENSSDNVTVPAGDCATALRPAANDATTPKVGEKLADGTIYAGEDLAATPSDAPGLYKWNDAKQYCEGLVANGHDDWTLPTGDQLNQLYQNKDAGILAGSFNDSAKGKTLAHYYWSSELQAGNSSNAWVHRFSDGYEGGLHRDLNVLSVRCVRTEPVAP